MDDEVIGFGVQVRETGRKSFTLDYMFEGRRRRFFIGDFPDWSTNATREHTAGLTASAALHESESGPEHRLVRRGHRECVVVDPQQKSRGPTNERCNSQSYVPDWTPQSRASIPYPLSYNVAWC